MKKIDMINEMNEILGFEAIPAWTSYSYWEIHTFWSKLKTGKYILEQRGYEMFLVHKDSRNRVKDPTLMAKYIYEGNTEGLLQLGFKHSTVQAYMNFVRAAKIHGERAIQQYPRLNTQAMTLVIAKLEQDNRERPQVIQDYTRAVKQSLDNLGIDELFYIKDITDKLIYELGLDRE